MANPIHLSVVATSRNDDHGKNLLARMQAFVDGFIAQCQRHDLQAELILVEWNPPENKSSLAEVLKFPENKYPCSVRIITVPAALHDTLQHANQLPLFQMIAKNVGIRRARGEYILATNIDILFSDAVIQCMREKLEPAQLYRVNRVDVPATVEMHADYDKTLTFCEAYKFRINGKKNTRAKIHNGWKRIAYIPVWRRVIQSLREDTRSEFTQKVKRSLIRLFSRRLHTNACGDFTLLSRQDWFALRGYPEWEMYSWHIDSVLLYQAYYNGIKQIIWPTDAVIYHMEHEVGSGYTPEAANRLFERLQANHVSYLDDKALRDLITAMRKTQRQGKPIMYNPENWGFADHQLTETCI